MTSNPHPLQTPKQLLGKAGEQKATKFLQSRGYRIHTVNFHSKFGEIDIIAQEGREIVFVEVKTRTHSDVIHPSEAVDEAKINRIIQTGIQYLEQNNINLDFRCDIVTILPNSIEHFENVTFE